MISTAISWYFRQRHDELWQLIAEAEKHQLELLEQYSDKLSRTIYGKNYGVKAKLKYAEFSRDIPVVSYEDLKPYIERTMNGEQQLLWPADITWFAKSSGTTGNDAKFIPISYESLEYTHYMGSRESLTQHFAFYPDAKLFEGKGLLIGGSHKVHQVNSKCYYGDLSAVLMNHMPLWANWKSTPDINIAMMDNWEEKLEKMAHATIAENVTSMSGVPTWTSVLLNRILEITGKNNMHEIWPNLELFIHGGMNFEPYRHAFSKLLPNNNMHYVETYNASEGFFGVQAYPNQSDLLLMTHHGTFFEFYPVQKGPDFIVPLWDIQVGVNYAVVITNNSGLWRYVIGDTIQFTNKNPYTFKITGRTKLFINAFGEELVIENAEKAISITAQKFGVEIIDYTAAPLFEKNLEGHEWLIEFSSVPNNMEAFTEVLDVELKKVNSDYEGKRFGNLVMKMPKITAVPKGTFHDWLQLKGKLGGQNKVPRLSNNRIILEEILNLIHQSSKTK